MSQGRDKLLNEFFTLFEETDAIKNASEDQRQEFRNKYSQFPDAKLLKMIAYIKKKNEEERIEAEQKAAVAKEQMEAGKQQSTELLKKERQLKEKELKKLDALIKQLDKFE